MTPAPELTLGSAVDWQFAATVGRRLAPAAPASTAYNPSAYSPVWVKRY